MLFASCRGGRSRPTGALPCVPRDDDAVAVAGGGADKAGGAHEGQKRKIFLFFRRQKACYAGGMESSDGGWILET